MKICFVGPANSAHIIKWCNWFINNGHEVHVVSFVPGEINRASVHLIDINVNVEGNDLGKLRYLLTGRKIKRFIESINPDVISVHYATSYGIAIALSGIKKYTLSVWGSDIFEFPRKSLLHKYLLKYSLSKAPYIFSTSISMAKETNKYTKKHIEVTPFGVDMNLFSPNKITEKNSFVVGTVKTMSDIYGIDTIIQSICVLKKNHPEDNIYVRIAGSGPKLEEYKNLSSQLGVDSIISFLGNITQVEAAKEWALMDIAIIPSRQESFGVAAVEAQACGTPVIISNVAGLLETTDPGNSSLVVDVDDEYAICENIHKLYTDRKLLKKMGLNAREYVKNKYDIDAYFYKIEQLFYAVSNKRL